MGKSIETINNKIANEYINSKGFINKFKDQFTSLLETNYPNIDFSANKKNTEVILYNVSPDEAYDMLQELIGVSSSQIEALFYIKKSENKTIIRLNMN